jgi:hypothetical protein
MYELCCIYTLIGRISRTKIQPKQEIWIVAATGSRKLGSPTRPVPNRRGGTRRWPEETVVDRRCEDQSRSHSMVPCRPCASRAPASTYCFVR